MEIKTVARLAELMSQHGLTKLEVKDSEISIHLEREVCGRPESAVPVQADCCNVSQSDAPQRAASKPAIETITSPMPGTFYAASSPDALPLVKVGDAIKPDTTVCIVEAMKVMNEVKSEIAGTITKILVADGSPVEFGQPLFEITP